MNLLTRFGLERSRFTITIMVSLLALGFTLYAGFPKREDPVVVIRTAVVTSSFAGMAPERIEKELSALWRRAAEAKPGDAPKPVTRACLWNLVVRVHGDLAALLRTEVAAWISHCEHVLLNELEVASLVDSQDLTVAIDRLTAMLKPGATLVVKTGSRGAIGVQGGHRFQCAAPVATGIFDTIGAGDSFNAGYLLARLNGCGLADAVAAGCNTASTIITRFPRRSLARGELAGQLARLHPRMVEET